ncbi:hypothetical protein CFD26_106559 [Aspergillus turcosus]|uniref:Uncharacterized protein n=1 Tax=Aspergillus turcosus TaxID=1245748 RepID=A0A421DIB4_9EURO|nr:hypothetical protein CFD26_106559 [Aspergillus turcosus]
MFVASSSTKVTPSVSTPAALTEITVGEFIICDAFEGFPGMDAMATTKVLPEDHQYQFEPNAFDLMHQMHNGYNKAGLYQQLSLPEGQIGENFEFTDFITDCF